MTTMEVPGIENVTLLPDNSTHCHRSYTMTNFLHGATIPSILIIIVLAFLNRRKHKRECCNGRPGIVVPLNFLDGYKNRWAYAVAFGACTNSIVVLFYNGPSQGLGGVEAPNWAKAFLFVVQVLEISIDYYPLFACLASPHKLVGSLLGFCHTCTWLVIQLIRLFECPNPEDVDSEVVVQLGVKYQGLILQWPACICLILLALKFVHIFSKAVWRRQFVQKEKLMIAYPHQVTYVRCLFQHSLIILTRESGKTFWERYRYRSIPGFVYPARLFCVTLVIVTLLYQVGFATVFVGGKLFGVMYSFVKSAAVYRMRTIIAFNGTDNNTASSEDLLQIVVVAEVWWYTATVLSVLLVSSYLYLILRNYRIHMLKLYRGDRSFIPTDELQSPALMAGSMRWAGYQIAYLVWGFLVCLMFVFLFGLALIYLIYLPILFKKDIVVLQIFEILIVPLGLNILIYYIQVIVARFTFLQGRIEPTHTDLPLAVDNRQVYENAAYFMFIFNISIGAISSLFRLVLSMVIGVVTLGRIDRSLLQRGYETWDRGFHSYIGMLFVDYTHNHPVLRVFCKILANRHMVTPPDSQELDFPVSERRTAFVYGTYGSSNSNPLHDERPTDVFKSADSVARKRWFIAYTLIHNPTLIQYRKGRTRESEGTDNEISALSGRASMSKYRQQVMVKLAHEGERPILAHRFYSQESRDLQESMPASVTELEDDVLLKA